MFDSRARLIEVFGKLVRMGVPLISRSGAKEFENNDPISNVANKNQTKEASQNMMLTNEKISQGEIDFIKLYFMQRNIFLLLNNIFLSIKVKYSFGQK